jgi:serine/threonine-protein kinase HipA
LALPDALSVYMENELICSVHRTDPPGFSYARSWLSKPNAQALHVTSPLTPGVNDSPQVHAIFENSLPEGEQRKRIGLRRHGSSVFGMLAMAGGGLGIGQNYVESIAREMGAG